MRRRIAVLVPLLAVALVGCGSSPPYKSAPRPQLPPAVHPSPCSTTGDNHTLGQCLPQPSGSVGAPTASLGGGPLCVDLSNNDPVYGLANWRKIAKVVRCAIFKVTEGTGFADQTAATMARYARAAGLLVGGYDFQHVCGDSAVAEAHFFTSHLRADGLTGPGAMHPWADVELRTGSCDARNWETAWQTTVANDMGGHVAGTYTGAWFWNPTFGCDYWAGGDSWISGYDVSAPAMPCGHSHLDMWQNTDRGFNGVTDADRSVWLDAASFRAASGAVAKPKPTKAQVARWTRARDSSQRAYARRSCPTLAQRERWFGARLHGALAAKHRRALALSVAAYGRHDCAVFAQRVRYFDHKLKGA